MILKNVFTTIENSETPFNENVLNKVKIAGILVTILTFAKSLGIAVKVGLSFWCVYCILDYGVELQKNEDETLQEAPMGKIILRLDRVMADRKISLKERSEQVGVTNVNLSKIKTGKISAIRFSTLEAICETLNCQPGDILEYDPNAASEE